MNKSTRSIAKSESEYTSPQKTARSERSGGRDTSKSPKKGKTKTKKKKNVEDLEIIDLFPEMDPIENVCRRRLINTQKHGTPLFLLNAPPYFRYMPSRAIMQRLIRRTTQLPEYFTTFELDMSAF